MSLGMSGVQPCLPFEFLLCGPKEMMLAADSSLLLIFCVNTHPLGVHSQLSPLGEKHNYPAG